MISNSLVRVKDGPPFTKDNEASVMLNPLARTSYDPKTGSYSFAKLVTAPAIDTANVKAVAETLAHSNATAGVGVDQGTSLPVSLRSTGLLILAQNSSLPYPRGTRRSSSATSPRQRSRTAAFSPHLRRLSRLAGSARRRSSSHWACRLRVLQRQ